MPAAAKFAVSSHNIPINCDVISYIVQVPAAVYRTSMIQGGWLSRSEFNSRIDKTDCLKKTLQTGLVFG